MAVVVKIRKILLTLSVTVHCPGSCSYSAYIALHGKCNADS